MSALLSNFVHDFRREAEGVLKKTKAAGSAAQYVQTYCSNPDKPRLPFDFTGREYLIEPLNDNHSDIIVMKGSQGGFTVMFFYKSIRELDIRQGKSLIYTLPRKSDLSRFFKTRLKKMMRGCTRLRMLNDTRDDIAKMSSVAIPVGDTWMLLLPTFSDSEGISDPACGIVNDELDKSNLDVVSRYTSRLGAEENPFKWKFSNPSYKGYGIDALYELSDQNVWMIKCPHCNEWQPQFYEPESRWQGDENPFIIIPKNGGEAYYACVKCNRKLFWSPDIKAQFVPKFRLPRLIDGIQYNRRGYHWSQINGWAFKSAQRIIDDFNAYEIESEAYNMVLGKPYTAGIAKINKSEVKDCQDNSLKWEMGNRGKTLILAADQGENENFYMLMFQDFNENNVCFNIIWAEISKEMMFDSKDKFGNVKKGRLTVLKEIFAPAIIVIDAQPNSQNSYIACRNEAGLMWRVYYVDSQKIPIIYKNPDPLAEKTDYVVTVNKTMVADMIAQGIKSLDWRLPNLDDAPNNIGKEIIKHLITPIRKEEMKRGRKTASWQGKPDHFFNVMIYLYVGAKGLEHNAVNVVCAPIMLGINS